MDAREASATRAIVLVPLLLLALVPAMPAGASHEQVVLLDAVATPDELATFTFTPPAGGPDAWSASMLVACEGTGPYAFRQSRVEGDPFYEGVCGPAPNTGESWWELPVLYHGAESSVTLRTSGPTRVVVLAEPAFDRFNDHRPFHAFHWESAYASGLGASPLLVGRFTPPVDLADARLWTSGFGSVEVYEVAPQARLVGVATVLQNEVALPDIMAGATYVVHMGHLAMCQPQCWAHADVDIRGVPEAS